MAIFGPDVSSYQGNVNWPQVRAEGFDFAIVKCTQGNNYLSPYYTSQLNGARAAGLLVAVYHYIEAASSADAQADWFDRHCGDKSLPIIVDHEEGSGNEAQNWAVVCALRARGYRVVLNYMPEWYWQQIGSPAISFGPMWKSWYPDMNQDYASAIYARCPASAWSDYGGQPVALRQFTSSALVAGQVLDCSAFEGTRDELAALFNNQEDDMATPDEVADAVLNRLLGAPGYWSQTSLGGAALTLWTAMYGDATGTQGLSDNSVVGMLKTLTRKVPSTVEGSTYSADGMQMAANSDGYGYNLTAAVAELKTLIQGLSTPTVDVDALSTQIAAKLNEATSALTPDEIQAVAAATATAVADEEAKRLAS